MQIRSLLYAVTLAAGIALPVVAENFTYTLLPGGGDFSQANGINNTGTIVGGNSLYSQGVLTNIPDSMQGLGINNSGQIAGFEFATGGQNAALDLNGGSHR